MKTFLITMVIVYGLRSLAYLGLLFNNKYPRMEYNEASHDVIGLVIALGFGAWAFSLLM